MITAFPCGSSARRSTVSDVGNDHLSSDHQERFTENRRICGDPLLEPLFEELLGEAHGSPSKSIRIAAATSSLAPMARTNLRGTVGVHRADARSYCASAAGVASLRSEGDLRGHGRSRGAPRRGDPSLPSKLAQTPSSLRGEKDPIRTCSSGPGGSVRLPERGISAERTAHAGHR